jgi:uncharacterized protein YbaA (DUF1428 family)
MKQTSIEWLIEEMMKKGFFKESVTLTNIDHLQYKAEEMHKEEIVEFAYMVYREKDNADNGYVNVEEYYEETFGSKGSDTLKDYHIVDTNEMVGQVPDVSKMVEDDELQYIRTQMEKAECYKLGYNRAKETLYTEEQVREAIRMATISDPKLLRFFYSEDYIIQSLKQPKQ